MFYIEHDFQVDFENFELNMKFHEERMQHSLCAFQLDMEIGKTTVCITTDGSLKRSEKVIHSNTHSYKSTCVV